MLRLDDDIRRLIDAFADGYKQPVRIGAGNVYLVPSTYDVQTPYIVAHVTLMDNGQTREGWVCACRGYMFGQAKDKLCVHIRDLMADLEADGKAKRWRGSTDSARTKRVTSSSKSSKNVSSLSAKARTTGRTKQKKGV